MKFQTLIIATLIFFLGSFGTQVQAQGLFNDTILVFNSKADFLQQGIQTKGLLVQGFILPSKAKSSFKVIAVSIAKKVKVPRATRVSSGPVTLKHKGDCYTFGCEQGSNCKNCKLHWYDRNGDGKVQPKRELRCLCEQGKMCRIRVKKSKC